MKNLRTMLLATVGFLILLLAGCQKEEKITGQLTAEELIKRGEYIVNTTGCHDCHSPKVFSPNGPSPDPNLLLSGHPAEMPVGKVNRSVLNSWVLFNHHSTAAVGQWGVSFSANITSDGTGIGNWTEEQFIKSMREGKFKGLDGSRTLLPPMPWPAFSNFTDEDLKAIFSYLKTVKPVRNVPPAPIPLAEVK